ncbi:STAS domain-containing protein [Streptomyces sp. NBC_00184]|uniref:STAS domain-containing protein n=1 Tax=unclassified Streptomyces TaxID=2593676 RepID=UPI002E2B1D86|nr:MULTISPECIES: STAS domain-containing protein [unclassified Streptomyces]
MNPLSPAVLVLSGHVTRAGVPRLCAELEAILAASRADVVDCDVGGITEPDLASVEAVARLSVVARRAGGRRLRLLHVPPELRSLLDLVGLADVVGLDDGAAAEAGRAAGS